MIQKSGPCGYFGPLVKFPYKMPCFAPRSMILTWLTFCIIFFSCQSISLTMKQENIMIIVRKNDDHKIDVFNLQVKNKKRWSQVMYMSYVLDFKRSARESRSLNILLRGVTGVSWRVETGYFGCGNTEIYHRFCGMRIVYLLRTLAHKLINLSFRNNEFPEETCRYNTHF